MTKNPVRRPLKELETLYLIKPNLRDIVVEGRDDAAWLKWYFAEHGSNDVQIYAVNDRVEIPSELVSRVHPDVNNRGRVVALANAFDSWSVPEPSLTCVIDGDFDLFEPAQETGSLLQTDHSSMEVYALTSRPLSKFLVASAKSTVEASELLSLLKPAWAVLYSVRYVLHRHSDGASPAERIVAKCIDKSGNIVADALELLRSAKPSPTGDFLKELLALHQDYLSRVPHEGLQGIRGHDIAPLLIRFLSLKNDLARPDQVERLMRMSVELKDLDDFDLFGKLRRRVLS